MKKYHKRCWYCGSKNMENKGDYSQCLDCGATYTDPLEVGPSPLDEKLSLIKDEKGNVITHARQPSKRLIRRAAKERALKG